MPVHHSEQSIQNKTIWFNMVKEDNNDDDDMSDRSDSSTLKVRQRKKKVDRMQEIHDKVSQLEKVSDQTKQSAFFILADETVDREGTTIMQTVDILPPTPTPPPAFMFSREYNMGVRDRAEETSTGSAREDLDFSNRSDEDIMRQINSIEREHKKSSLSTTPPVAPAPPRRSAPPAKPIKRFSEKNFVPRDVLVQDDALQKAMNRKRQSRRNIFSSIW